MEWCVLLERMNKNNFYLLKSNTLENPKMVF